MTPRFDDSPGQRRLSRRALLASSSAAALGLVACADEETPDLPVETPTPMPTQAEPTPTQEAIASPVAGYQDPTRWQDRTLTVATAGVSGFLDSMTEAFFGAFERDTGATVEHVSFGRDGVDNLTQQVESGEIVWDVILLPATQVLDLSNLGLLAAIDYNIVDATNLYAEVCMQHGVGAMLYSTTMVYSVSAETPPESWSDFWDLSLFDGSRALRRMPVGTLEFALLADGVERDRLYPLDVERAFSALEQIREGTRFYEDSKQPVELVRTGQVGLASAWSVRVILPDAASLVLPQWSGGMISADAWVTPRGSTNGDVAMSFINYATRAVPAANFSGQQPFGPVNKDALVLLPDDVVDSLPNSDEHLAVQFFENWSYWRDQKASLTTRFEDWLLNPTSTPVDEGD